MYVEDYAVYIDPIEKLHRAQIAACIQIQKRAEEAKAHKIKPRPRLQDFGHLWSPRYEPTAEDVHDIKAARAEGRTVPHQIVDLVIAKAARLEDPYVFLGRDFPKQFGRNDFYTPERYVSDIHPKEIPALLNAGGQGVLTSVWLERAAQIPEPSWLARIHGHVTASEPSEYTANLAMRLLKKAPEFVGPPREVFNRYDEFYHAPAGSYRKLMTDQGHDKAVEMLRDFDMARRQAEAERGAREVAEIKQGGIYYGLKYWIKDSLSLQCGPGGY